MNNDGYRDTITVGNHELEIHVVSLFDDYDEPGDVVGEIDAELLDVFGPGSNPSRLQIEQRVGKIARRVWGAGGCVRFAFAEGGP